jgi:hypothetical protein
VVPTNGAPAGANDHINFNAKIEPFYSFTCFNRNREAKARIRVMIRSWDVAGFTNVGTSYSPTTGTEPSYGGPYHDYWTWETFKADPSVPPPPAYRLGYPGILE